MKIHFGISKQNRLLHATEASDYQHGAALTAEQDSIK